MPPDPLPLPGGRRDGETTANGGGVVVTATSVLTTFPSSNVMEERVVKVNGGGVERKVVKDVVKCC